MAYTTLRKFEDQRDAIDHAMKTVQRDIQRLKENPEDTKYRPEDLEVELAGLPVVINAQNNFDLLRSRYGASHPKVIDAKRLLDETRKANLALLISRKRRSGDEKNEDELEELAQPEGTGIRPRRS